MQVLKDDKAVQHMMKVASGLDSMVLGEPQILGQMKSSYAVAQKAGTAGGLLSQVFQHVFATAKRVRSETAIGQNPVSVAYAAVSLAQRIFSSMQEVSALLIGAGETVEFHIAQRGEVVAKGANRTHRLLAAQLVLPVNHTLLNKGLGLSSGIFAMTQIGFNHFF